VNLLHEINAGYYKVEFWSSKDVDQYGMDHVEIVEMMLKFDQFDSEKVKRHAKIHGFDRIKITKYQEITTLLEVEESLCS
jgi:hypothetical protein